MSNASLLFHAACGRPQHVFITEKTDKGKLLTTLPYPTAIGAPHWNPLRVLKRIYHRIARDTFIIGLRPGDSVQQNRSTDIVTLYSSRSFCLPCWTYVRLLCRILRFWWLLFPPYYWTTMYMTLHNIHSCSSNITMTVVLLQLCHSHERLPGVAGFEIVFVSCHRPYSPSAEFTGSHTASKTAYLLSNAWLKFAEAHEANKFSL